MTQAEMTYNIVALIKQYAPKGTTFEWDNATRRFGCCHARYNPYTGTYTFKITISRKLAVCNSWETVRLTVLHEIAHARTPNHHHDEVWRRECLAIGGDGKRCYTSTEEGGNVTTIPTKYIGVCPTCGTKFPRNRRCNGYHCNRQSRIVWKVNPKFVGRVA